MSTQVSFDDISVAFSSKSDKELKKAYLIFASMNSSNLVKVGTSSIKGALKLGLPVAGLIKHTIFEHFCGGETIEDCEPTIKRLARFNIGTILDYSVEGEKTEKGFEIATEETVRTILRAKGAKDIPFSVFKVTGVANFDLLAKVQSGEELTEQEKKDYQQVVMRVDRICKTAYECDVPIFIDGEESWIQDAIDRLCYSMMARYNKEKVIVYNTFQMYRWEMLDKLKTAYQHALQHNYYLGAKLVRGAYMEKESARASEMGYKDPIQPSKEATDRDFDEAQLFCIEHLDRIELCSGSHNEKSNYYLMELMKEHGLEPGDRRVWFAQLFGMSDNISYNLANGGYNVAKYVPYGPVKAVMPYLFRRAEENTSIAGQTSREFLLVKNELHRRKLAKRH